LPGTLIRVACLLFSLEAFSKLVYCQLCFSATCFLLLLLHSKISAKTTQIAETYFACRFVGDEGFSSYGRKEAIILGIEMGEKKEIR